jgi:hypothetical protein
MGDNSTFPVLLQEELEINYAVMKTVSACTTLGCPIFLEGNQSYKVGQTGYVQAKSLHPLCLTSFLWKTQYRLVNRYIREEALEEYPLYSPLYASQTSRSAETVL